MTEFFDYQSLDWTQTDKALALATGLTVNQIRYQRTKLAMPKATRTGSRDWAALDWNKQDVEIAEQLNCASTLVGYWRRKLQRTRPPRYHKCRPHLLQQRIEQLRERTAAWDWTRQDVQLAEEIGLTRERVRQIRVRLSIPKSPNHRCRR
jgi:hypothetical protein